MLTKIINSYNTFILDIWGVLHDGHSLLPGAAEFIKRLEENGKQYYLLSNSPRPAAINHRSLLAMGLNIPQDNILTSGQFFLELLKNPALAPDVDLSGKAFVIGANLHTELMESAQLCTTESLTDASYLLMLAFADNEQELTQHSTSFKEAIALGIPMLCVNPDKTVIHHGNMIYCQGTFASSYEQLGGKVHYFGKPYREFYQYLFDLHGLNKKGAIMFGDSLETDIKGANDFGIDSAMLLTGIHKDERNVANLLKLSTTVPSYILDDLVEIYEQQKTRSFSA